MPPLFAHIAGQNTVNYQPEQAHVNCVVSFAVSILHADKVLMSHHTAIHTFHASITICGIPCSHADSALYSPTAGSIFYEAVPGRLACQGLSKVLQTL